MPNKEANRASAPENKQPVAAQTTVAAKNPGPLCKTVGGKTIAKESPMSPTPPAAPAPDTERTELLGSLTTQQQQRTSARVIKKLRLEPPADREKKGKRPDGQSDDIQECDTPNKIDDKEPLKFPTVKQRMPKALWSTDEKNLFFEALNEYGKDFDAITAYICAKMKKKGMSENLKTKTQVSHFYYRTWHKLSKHVHFDENVKKVAQELYALINYGELRKKLVSVSEKTCARLGEMVRTGSLALRVRGRTLRVRTPMCRALRRLNQINERACGARVCPRVAAALRARDAAAWARVQAAAHNPRAALAAPPRAPLHALLRALARRWTPHSFYKTTEEIDPKCPEYIQIKDEEVCSELRHTCTDDDDREDLGDHLNLELDRMIVQEQKLPKKPVLHVGPRPDAEIHLPVLSPSEQLSSQKICFSSYLERMCKQRRDNDGDAKLRTSKRQRKDSATDKEIDVKKIKIEEDPNKLMHIDETAIDGIDLMASYKNIQEDEEKPSTEDEKEPKSEETVEEEVEGSGELPEKDKYMSEKEKDSFSEMEDDEKYNKSDTDNESDQGKSEKSRKEQKFKNLKVKFRIRPKKRGGSIYTLVMDKEDQDPTSSKDEEQKPDIDVDTAIRQIRKGWSMYDAGDLTIGDLYLMFGSRSKLELDYWWAEPTPPLPQPLHKSKSDPIPPASEKDKCKAEKISDKGTDSSVEDERDRARESDNDIFSPKNTFSQDSNDGMSGDERKSEQLASPDHKSSSGCSGTLKLVSKLINRPLPAQTAQTQSNNGFSQLSDRLKRLLALAGNSLVSAATAAPGSGASAACGARCTCALGCALHRRQKQQPWPPSSRLEETSPSSAVFRHPTPIAPRADKEMSMSSLNLEGVPRWRRGRPRLADRRVVVQRLLPLLPKLPPPSNLIPVKIVPNSPPAPPRILPKPPPTSTSDLSFFYVLSESNGQFYFHDGDRRIPITPMQGNGADQHADDDEDTKDEPDSKDSKTDLTIEKHPVLSPKESSKDSGEPPVTAKCESSDLGQFLPSESLSLSPSRLLRDADGWLEGSVQDFSLSSFLGHLEGRPQPDLAVDSQLQSLMAESSVDYVAKFADLAAEVTDDPITSDDMT
ncbi:protein cramped [Galleria mellonella]|uniref:Protein cramped n=1 Tax=Galleria mellonella TaxID=7137 RepID=A0ABM3MEK9_GALME|nr:protein cramped [Galleria mellonella]